MKATFFKNLEKRIFPLVFFFLVAGCGGGGSDPYIGSESPAAAVPAEIKEAVQAANDLEQTFPVQFASGSAMGIRDMLSTTFPLYPDLLSDNEEARQYLRSAFTGTPGFEEDMKLVILRSVKKYENFSSI